MNEPIALICSVQLESEPLRRRIGGGADLLVGRRPAVRGSLGGVDVLLVVGGMGKTNAAQALTAAAERFSLRGVIGFGVAGAFPEAGIGIGEVALASEEIYGDEGAATPRGWISTEELGIPLLERGTARLFNRFPVGAARVSSARETLLAAGRAPAVGRFVTVSCCSGTAGRAAELAERSGAVCETMEGAAYAHVAAIYDLPFLEVRGVSNLVEDRDPSSWRLPEAAEACAAAVEVLVREWRD